VEAIIDAAAKSVLFAGLGRCEIERLIEEFAPAVKHFEKGEIIVLEGDDVSAMGLIVGGCAQAVKTNAAGDTLTAARLKIGDIFGDMLAASAHAKSPVTVQAESACTVAFIKYASLFEPKQTPRVDVLKNMLQNMSDKYFLQEQRVSVLAEKNLKNRITRFLRYEARAQGTSAISVPPRAQLAATLACDRAAMCRVLGEMQKSGEIELLKNVIVVK
jgi:CRP/FNR family transcriptional regulator, dissimilatory nitrate respiration regulator